MQRKNELPTLNNIPSTPKIDALKKKLWEQEQIVEALKKELEEALKEEAQNQLKNAQPISKPMVHHNFRKVENIDNTSVITLKEGSEGCSSYDAEQVIARIIKLKHPSILECKKAIPNNGKLVPVFHMEAFSDKTLLDILDAGFSEEKMFEIALTLVQGLIYYESQGLFPKLQLNSIMVCEDGKVKILDESIIKLDDTRHFSKSSMGIDSPVESKKQMLAMLPRAPETFVRRFVPTAQIATFSLGMILLQMFKGGEELATVDKAKTQKAFENAMNNDHPIPLTCPKFWSDLIQNCLNTNPGSRPTLIEINDQLIQQKTLQTQDAIKKVHQEKDSLLSKIPKEVMNTDIMNAIQAFGVFTFSDKSQSNTLDNSSNTPGAPK